MDKIVNFFKAISSGDWTEFRKVFKTGGGSPIPDQVPDAPVTSPPEDQVSSDQQTANQSTNQPAQTQNQAVVDTSLNALKTNVSGVQNPYNPPESNVRSQDFLRTAGGRLFDPTNRGLTQSQAKTLLGASAGQQARWDSNLNAWTLKDIVQTSTPIQRTQAEVFAQNQAWRSSVDAFIASQQTQAQQTQTQQTQTEQPQVVIGRRDNAAQPSTGQQSQSIRVAPTTSTPIYSNTTPYVQAPLSRNNSSFDSVFSGVTPETTKFVSGGIEYSRQAGDWYWSRKALDGRALPAELIYYNLSLSSISPVRYDLFATSLNVNSSEIQSRTGTNRVITDIYKTYLA